MGNQSPEFPPSESRFRTFNLPGVAALSEDGSSFAPPLAESTPPAGLVLTWPVNALGYTVQTSSDLGSGAWTTVAATPIANGSDQSVTLVVAPGAQRHYRLYHP